MANHPEVTFIICTFNRAGYLDDTLHSLLRHDYSGDPFEIIVVDNNSTDRTGTVVRRYMDEYNGTGPSVRHVREKKQGLSHARNRGIREARSPALVFADDDIRATGEFIPAWISFFKEYSGAEAAGGRIHVQFDDPRPEWMSHFLLPLLGHHDRGAAVKKYRRRNYPFGGNMGFRKTVFERHGLFNTDLGRSGGQLRAGEEKEFFRRLRKNGIEIRYLPRALLYHRVDKKRLTQDYIRRQALGLGQSLALQLKDESPLKKFGAGMHELGKLMVSAGLFFPYTLTLQYPKAVMLLKFRKWIAEGYFSSGIR